MRALGLTNSAALARRPRRRRDSRSPAAVRQRKIRAHHDNGEHHYRFWLPDRCVDGLILKCIQEQRLTPEQAMRPKLVKEAIKQLLVEEGFRWLP